MTRRAAPLLIATALLGLPNPVQAEGALAPFDCVIHTDCAALGACMPVDRPFRLILDPIDLAADGTGVFEMTIRDMFVRATLDTGQSLTWQEEDGSTHQLIFAGEGATLTATHFFQNGNEMRLQFMTCVGPL